MLASRCFVFLTLTVAIPTTIACSSDSTSPAQPPGTSDAGTNTDSGSSMASADIVDTAVNASTFKTLVSAVQAAGLESTLRGAGPFTVFAPTDDAFAKLPSFLLTKLVAAPYKTELGLILKYHVLSGKVLAADVLGKTQEVASVQGGSLKIDGANSKVLVNGTANVTKADVGASNGTIHAIDQVLLPNIVDTASGYDDGTVEFASLVTAVKAADLVSTLSGPGPFTVFAPTDAAFAALKTSLGAVAFDAILADKAKLTKLLTYHVVPAAVYEKDVAPGSVKTLEGGDIAVSTSGGVKITDSTTTPANVVLTDLPNSNGVIHVIDKVLLPTGL